MKGISQCLLFLCPGADDQVGIWRTEDYELIGLFPVHKRISCLKVHDAKMLVCGHSTGHITTWSLNICQDSCEARMLNKY